METSFLFYLTNPYLIIHNHKSLNLTFFGGKNGQEKNEIKTEQFESKKFKETEFDSIIEGLKKYIKANEKKEKRYLLNPTTYLNGRRWEDEIELPETEEERWERLERMAKE